MMAPLSSVAEATTNLPLEGSYVPPSGILSLPSGPGSPQGPGGLAPGWFCPPDPVVSLVMLLAVASLLTDRGVPVFSPEHAQKTRHPTVQTVRKAWIGFITASWLRFPSLSAHVVRIGAGLHRRQAGIWVR
jgi:hypothetical protein